MDGEPLSDHQRLVDRLETARSRQGDLVQRVEKLKRTMARATGRELSDKERTWIREVQALQDGVTRPESGEPAASRIKQPWKRLEEIQALRNDLVRQADMMTKANGEAGEDEVLSQSVSSLKIPSEIRKVKIGQVKALLDRETALVEAVKSRLERLAVG